MQARPQIQSHPQPLVINNINLGDKNIWSATTLLAAIILLGRMMMNALNESGHDYAKCKNLPLVKATHRQKKVWFFCLIVLVIFILYIFRNSK